MHLQSRILPFEEHFQVSDSLRQSHPSWFASHSEKYARYYFSILFCQKTGESKCDESDIVRLDNCLAKWFVCLLYLNILLRAELKNHMEHQKHWRRNHKKVKMNWIGQKIYTKSQLEIKEWNFLFGFDNSSWRLMLAADLYPKLFGVR